MAKRAKEKFKSLVVDDDSMARESLAEILEEAGYVVDTAEDGVEALGKVKSSHFDTVLSDIWMPKMNGIELLREIKKFDATLPVVMITGYPDVRIAVEAIKEGASDFITKPFRLEQVEVLLEKIVKERTILLENAQLLDKLRNKKTIEDLNIKLHKKIKELSILYSISESLSDTLDEEELFEKIVNMACEITEAKRSSLMILNRESKELVIKATKGTGHDIRKGTRYPLGSGIAGKVALSGNYTFVNGLTESPCLYTSGIQYNTDSFISVPLKIKNEIFGVLNVTNRSNGGRFTEEEVYLLLALAKKAALSIETSILYENIYNTIINTLKAMINAIEARDEYTKQHSQRVTEIAMAIAKEMKCSNEEIETIKLGGFLHDIGKIGIRDSILLKPGKLTKGEFNVIKDHPIIGENIVKPLDALPIEKLIIRHHHERWDGKGYPDGLCGQEIPLLARILSVADAFDSMISNRPYREPKSKEESLAEIERLSGHQFDSEIVKKFKKIVKHKFAATYSNKRF